MQCTNCSNKVKPVVAIDIDGTLGDYHGHFIKFASIYLDRELNPDYDGSVEMHEHLGLPLMKYREVKLAYRQGGAKRSLPRYDGAAVLVNRLREVAEVFITTTRPYLRLDQTDPDTRFWLEKQGIEYDGLLFHEDKYQKLSAIVDARRVVAILDDLPEQYDAAKLQFGNKVPILRKTRYNSAVNRPNMVSSLPEALAAIHERVQDWEKSHDDQIR